MNAVLYALNEIKNQIPEEVLLAAMNIDSPHQTYNPYSLEEKIRNKVILNRVIPDCNVTRGQELVIPLNNVQPTTSEMYYTVYRIPPELTDNRAIMSVLGLTYIPVNYMIGNYSSFITSDTIGSFHPGNSITNVADRIGNAASDAAIVTNTHVELIGHNTILVYANYRTVFNYGARVVLEYDENMQGISPRSFKAFSYLCVLAAKAYIYNKLIVKLNSGYLQGGQELGKLQQIIESYEGSEEEYRTYLKEVWKPVAWMNDTTAYNRFVRSMLAPDL